MNYSPLFDAAVTTAELAVLAAVAVNYIFDEIFWSRCAAMFRFGRMWGGE